MHQLLLSNEAIFDSSKGDTDYDRKNKSAPTRIVYRGAVRSAMLYGYTEILVSFAQQYVAIWTDESRKTIPPDIIPPKNPPGQNLLHFRAKSPYKEVINV